MTIDGTAPIFTPALVNPTAYILDMNEGSTAVGSVAVANATAGQDNGSTITYSLEPELSAGSTYDNDKFIIDPSTGVLSFIDAPDFEDPQGELSNTYLVNVRASDAAGNATDQTVRVNVNDLNDEVPELNETVVNAIINENAEDIVLSTFTISDADAAATNALVEAANFTVTSTNPDGGLDAGLVDIVAGTTAGEFDLVLTAPVDYETNPNLDVSVTYNDGENDSTAVDVSVWVNNLFEPTTGNDVLLYQGIPLDGLAGTDRIYLEDSANLTISDYANLSNIEIIDLTSNGGHILDGLTLDNIYDMTEPIGSAGLLSIVGDSIDGDQVNAIDTAGWLHSSTTVGANTTQYIFGNLSAPEILYLTISNSIDNTGL